MQWLRQAKVTRRHYTTENPHRRHCSDLYEVKGRLPTPWSLWSTCMTFWTADVGESWETNCGKSSEGCRAKSAGLVELTCARTRSLCLCLSHSAVLVIYLCVLHIKQRCMAILLTSDLLWVRVLEDLSSVHLLWKTKRKNCFRDSELFVVAICTDHQYKISVKPLCLGM